MIFDRTGNPNRSWDRFGVDLGSLVVPLGSLGPPLGSLGASWGDPGGSLRCSWALLGVPGGPWKVLQTPPGCLLGHLGPPRVDFRASWVDLEPIWGRLGPIFGRLWYRHRFRMGTIRERMYTSAPRTSRQPGQTKQQQRCNNDENGSQEKRHCNNVATTTVLRRSRTLTLVLF